MRVFKLLVLPGLLLLLGCNGEPPGPATPATTAEILLAKGKEKSRMCTACHGPQGISRVASYPSLAGKPEAYLVEQLQAFRSGVRENPMMSSIAKSLSDEDIAALGHYYAQQPAAASAGLPQ